MFRSAFGNFLRVFENGLFICKESSFDLDNLFYVESSQFTPPDRQLILRPA